MILYSVLFYLLAGLILAATALAVTRRHAVHAVVYLVISFIGCALLFYLLGAPLLAALEVIVYAGAIMVLFLFIIMMLRLDPPVRSVAAYARQWAPALLLGILSLCLAAVLIAADPGNRTRLPLATATPREFGHFLFSRYALPVEIASFLLFVALVGALYLGRQDRGSKSEDPGESR